MKREVLTFEVAQSLVEACLSEATRRGLKMAVSVTDAGGHLVAFARMDEVTSMAVDVTRRKAITAGNFRLPTKVLSVISNSDPALAMDLTKSPDICIVPGGLPIMLDSQCVGGLGVAGGNSEQDQTVAEATLAILLPLSKE